MSRLDGVKRKVDPRELPEEVVERIDPAYDETIIMPLASILYLGQRAWYTKSQLEYRLRENHSVDVSKKAITKRLDRLQDLELVEDRKIGSTNIYYWNADESDWPIPPDVILQSEYSELIQTLSTTYAWWGVFGVLGIFVGGVLTLIGALASAGAIPLPVSSGSVIAVALLTLFCSYALAGMYLVAALFDITVDPDLPSFME